MRIRKIILAHNFIDQQEATKEFLELAAMLRVIYGILVPDIPLQATFHKDEAGQLLESFRKRAVMGFSQKQLAILADYFNGALVIGRELPRTARTALTRLGIPYLDFAPHPAHFLGAHAYCAGSNIRGITQHFLPWHIPDAAVALAGARLMAKAACLPRLPVIDPRLRTAIYVCQVPEDKALKQGRKNVKVENFAPALSKMAREYDRILVLPVAGSADAELLLLRLYPKTVKAEGDFIQLLSHENVEAVYSLASPLSMAASYLLKKGVCLSHPPLELTAAEITEEAYLPLREDALADQNLWVGVLSMLRLEPRKPEDWSARRTFMESPGPSAQPGSKE